MTNIQVYCPPSIKLRLYKKFNIPSAASPMVVERWCQFGLKKYWTGKGEWFKVSTSKATAIIIEAIKRNLPESPVWYIQKHQAVIIWKRIGPAMANRKRLMWKHNVAYRAKMEKVLKQNRDNRTARNKLKQGRSNGKSKKS